ncbi:hypothetical protein PTUN_a1512 [Pseudoalteromonas tunicata]|uniref:Uncharacterized protein n=1 Tax=Pseudoalteromonas tunicata D2 TaxID=87626 RepID=A4CFM9_9GAMM|nr:hypothetical protein PTUN_a1512 [Pseudoalteromonas tunicata]EAR26456.1 hypothetical protein PTD2_04696 [Pseudoalteromonas tunicata D2]
MTNNKVFTEHDALTYNARHKREQRVASRAAKRRFDGDCYMPI